MAEGERSLAVFVDFENLALGFQGRRERFDIARVLERLVEKGKIVVKKAYADWNRFATFTQAMHEAAIELIEIPRRAQTGKNSADIRLCVDAMDLAYSKEHINTFVVVSGDSDFSPLVSKLKELGKHVIGLGMQQSTSELLRDNCDEFIYYEDLNQGTSLPAPIESHLSDTKRKAFSLLLESLLALRRENKEVLWSSMVKDTMKRKKPSFNETYHGYRTFSELLEDAQREGLLELDTDKRSRTYVVTRFGSELTGAEHVEGIDPAPPTTPFVASTVVASPAPEAPDGPAGGPIKKKSRRRRRRGQGAAAGPGNGNGAGGVHGPSTGFKPVVIPPGPAPGIAVVTPPSPGSPTTSPATVDARPESPEPVFAAAPRQQPRPEPARDFAAGIPLDAEEPAPPPAPAPSPAPKGAKPTPPPAPEPAPVAAAETEPEPAAEEPTQRARTRSTRTPRPAGTAGTRTTRRTGTRKTAEKPRTKPASDAGE